MLRAIRAAHARGGLVAGSSAGAAMMSEPMILGGTSIGLDSRQIQRARQARRAPQGLGFFSHGLVRSALPEARAPRPPPRGHARRRARAGLRRRREHRHSGDRGRLAAGGGRAGHAPARAHRRGRRRRGRLPRRRRLLPRRRRRSPRSQGPQRRARPRQGARLGPRRRPPSPAGPWRNVLDPTCSPS